MNEALMRSSSAGGVRGGLLPPASPQLNNLSSYQALAGADIRSLEQECHDHPSLPCACTEGLEDEMRDSDEMHWDRIAVWLMGISVFMFLIATFMAMRNGTGIIGALALTATGGAGMVATTTMAMTTIFPRGNDTPAETRRRKFRNARHTAIAMAATAMGMVVTLMGSIVQL